MVKMNKKLLPHIISVGVFVVLISACVSSNKVTDDGLLEYYIDGRESVVLDYLGSDLNIIIPDKIEGKKVRAVTFVYPDKIEKLESIVLPGDVTYWESWKDNNERSLRFKDYYEANKKAAGTYSWKDGTCYFNGVPLKQLKQYATISGFENWTLGNPPSGTQLVILRANGIQLDDNDTWKLDPGKYNLTVYYRKADRDDLISPDFRVNGEIKDVLLEAGKFYVLQVIDPMNLHASFSFRIVEEKEGETVPNFSSEMPR
jgi:hypothetical protein